MREITDHGGIPIPAASEIVDHSQRDLSLSVHMGIMTGEVLDPEGVRIIKGEDFVFTPFDVS